MKLTRLAIAAAIAAMPVAAMAMPASEYVMKAGASDLFEKQSAMLVLQSTRNPQVRDFANMMVMDHGKSTDMVKAAAMRAGLHPAPPMLSPSQQGMISQLRAARGMRRDTLYVAQQKMAHKDALMLQKSYSTTGSVAPLQHAATDIVPVVEQHIAKLQRMSI